MKTHELKDVSEAQKLLGSGFPPGEEVNLAYKMWFMTDKDYDFYMAIGAVLLVIAGVVYGKRRIGRRN